MASKPRNFNPNLYYHIYNRAVLEKREIFASPHDYQRFLNTIVYYLLEKRPVRYADFQNLSADAWQSILHPKGVLAKRRAKLVAYVIMPNHFHLLMKPEEKPQALSQFLSDLANSYTRYFNLKYKRSGVLFQGTFKSKEIADEASLLQVSRYIHLNPLNSSKTNPSGMLKTPQEYPFSSYHEWLGLKEPHIVDAGEVKFWIEKANGPQNYQRFTEAKIGKNPALGIENLTLE